MSDPTLPHAHDAPQHGVLGGVDILFREMTCGADGGTAAAGKGYAWLVPSEPIEDAHEHGDALENDDD